LGAVVKRREFILALGGGAAFGWTLAARAQTNRVPRIGVLSSDPVASIYIKAFLQGLRDLGYVEGQNIIVERYAAENSRLPEQGRRARRTWGRQCRVSGPAAPCSASEKIRPARRTRKNGPAFSARSPCPLAPI